MVGVAQEGGNYRKVVVGVAVAGTVGLALYLGVKQLRKWKSEQSSDDSQEAEKASMKESELKPDTKKLSAGSGFGSKSETKESPQSVPQIYPFKPSPTIQPAKDKQEGIKGKQESYVPPKAAEPEKSSIETVQIEIPKRKPTPPQPKPKPSRPLPTPETPLHPEQSGEAVKSDTDIVVIEEPWSWSKPQEQSPVAADRKMMQVPLQPLVQPLEPITTQNTNTQEGVGSREIPSMPVSLGSISTISDDIEIIQDNPSVFSSFGAESEDFIKFEPDAVSPPSVELSSASPIKNSERSKITQATNKQPSPIPSVTDPIKEGHQDAQMEGDSQAQAP